MSINEEQIPGTERLLNREGKPFTMVLMTIYSVENAGIRYVSAALQRELIHKNLYIFYSERCDTPTDMTPGV